MDLNHWSKGRYVGALFVDVKAAFPTLNPTPLAHTLYKQGFAPAMIHLVSAYLTLRKKTGFPQGFLISREEKITRLLYTMYTDQAF